MTTLAQQPPRTRRDRRSGPDQDGPGVGERAFKGVVLTIMCALVVLPFVGVLSTSLASPSQVVEAGGFVLFPRDLDLEAFRTILSGGVVTQALVVSAVITIGGTAVSLVGSTLLAYALSRPGTFGQRPILLIVLFSLLFSPGIIPNYLVVKETGLLDSLWALILPTAISGFNVIVLRSFIMSIHPDIIDSARMDGASELHTLLHVVLPMSKAVLAVIGLFYAVGYWNSFFNALLYLSDSGKWPLQLVLRSYVVNNTQFSSSELGSAGDQLPPQPSIQMAILVVSLVPILLVYPFLQRHFTKGQLTGAVKG